MDKTRALLLCIAVSAACSPNAKAPSSAAAAPARAAPEEDIEGATAKVRAEVASGRLDEALAHAERYHRSTVERVGRDDLAASLALMLLGQVHAARGEAAEALASFRRALPAVERSLGPGNDQIGQMLINIAGYAASAGRPDEASDAAARAIRILEQARGENDPDVAVALSALGRARLDLDDAAGSAAAFRRALEIRDRILKPSDVLIGVSAASLATAEYTRGNDGAAARLYERSLAIFEKDLDNGLDVFAEAADRLARIRPDDPAANEALLRHALSVVEGKRGRRHAAYVQLASSLYSILAPRQTDDYVSAQMEELGVRARCAPTQACGVRGTPSTKGPPIAPSAAMTDAMGVLQTLRPRYGACVEAARVRNPKTDGIVQLTLDVGSAGTVSFVRSAAVGLDDPTVSCLVDAALEARFKPPSGGHAIVLQPLSVTPRR